jgi:hypothetical protein
MKTVQLSIFALIAITNFAHGSNHIFDENDALTDFSIFDDQADVIEKFENWNDEEKSSYRNKLHTANQQLLTAAKNGTVEDIISALGNAADPDYQDEDGNTAALIVEKRDPYILSHIKLKATLRHHNAKNDIPNKDGETAENILSEKLAPYTDPIIDFLCHPKPLPDGSYETQATIVNNENVIQASAERVLP